MAFDAVITGHERNPAEASLLDDELDAWRRDAEGLDARVQLDTPLVLGYEDQPFSVFNA